jgi:HlyD family secretion protein
LVVSAANGNEAVPGTSAPRARWRRVLGGLVALALAAGAAFAWRQGGTNETGPRYETAAVTRGTLAVTVVANGTLAPTRSVNVGSELSGTVAAVHADVNDRVKRGQILVQLDTARLTDQISRSRASLAAAEAKLAQTGATLNEARGNLARMEEVARLSGGKVPSATELDAARAAVARGVADENSARASVADTRAALSLDETNLRKASIRAPIDGVVLTRSVDPGNAVAASLQAVTLVTIAADLTRLKLQVNVDEADVGQVKDGQTASFVVSAWPNRTYPATITRVGFGSTTKDNVVTYLTDLEVRNDDLSLRPGMTAVASIAAVERRDALLVPNAALRFTPAEPSASKAGGGGIVARLVPRPPNTSGPRKAIETTGAERRVWVLRDGKPAAVAVKPGLTDGRMTEIEGELREGDAVIVDRVATKPS